MHFYDILIPCLISGVIFVGLAVWLTTKKGNTISDILNSQKFNDEKGIRLEIKNIVSISSSYPIVGLYVIAALVAIGLPSFAYWQSHKELINITLSGFVVKETDKKVSLVSERVGPTGSFKIPLTYHPELQTFNFESQYYSPLTLNITIDKDNQVLTIKSNDPRINQDLDIDIDKRIAVLAKPIELTPTNQIDVQNEPTTRVTFADSARLDRHLSPFSSDTAAILQPIHN